LSVKKTRAAQELSVMESPTKEQKKTTEPAKARVAKAAPAKASKLPKKLLLFDIDLLEAVKSGSNTQDKLLLLTGVDPFQFAQRADFLCAKGFLCRDSANPSVFRLGISGYDELAKRKAAEEKKSKKTGAPSIQHVAANAAEQLPVGSLQSLSKLTERDSPLVYLPGPEHKPAKQTDIDLFELLRKGSPKTGNESNVGYNGNGTGVAVKIQTAIASAPVGQQMPFEKQVETLGGRDAVKEMIEKTTQAGVCELCQAPFHLSVNTLENNPKYGYCFCGASYHKDCYEHLVNSRSSCVRCGKKLQIRMDRASEDAVRAVKKLFD